MLIDIPKEAQDATEQLLLWPTLPERRTLSDLRADEVRARKMINVSWVAELRRAQVEVAQGASPQDVIWLWRRLSPGARSMLLSRRSVLVATSLVEGDPNVAPLIAAKMMERIDNETPTAPKMGGFSPADNEPSAFMVVWNIAAKQVLEEATKLRFQPTPELIKNVLDERAVADVEQFSSEGQEYLRIVTDLIERAANIEPSVTWEVKATVVNSGRSRMTLLPACALALRGSTRLNSVLFVEPSDGRREISIPDSGAIEIVLTTRSVDRETMNGASNLFNLANSDCVLVMRQADGTYLKSRPIVFGRKDSDVLMKEMHEFAEAVRFGG